MGFSVRLAPGMRIAASPRGLRAYRLGGGAAVDAPFTFFSALGGARPVGARPSTAAYQRQVDILARQAGQVQRMEHARAIADTFERMLEVHRIEFEPASRPAAPAPAQPDRLAIHRDLQRATLADVGLLRLSQRRQARLRALALTDVEVERQWALACDERAELQSRLDKRWLRLCANDPEVVLETLEEAFEANETPAAAIGVEGPEVVLAIRVPTVDSAVPEHLPAATRSGVRELSGPDRAVLYRRYISGQVLVAVREAFAVAPRLHAARVAVLRREPADHYGRPWVSCLLAAHLDRSTLEDLAGVDAEADAIVGSAATELVVGPVGPDGAMYPIDLNYEPDLIQLVQAADFA